MGIDAKPAFLEVVDGRALSWRQPKWTRAAWELNAGDERIATLARARWFGFTMRAHSPGGEWDVVMRWSGPHLSRAGSTEPLIRYRSMLMLRGKMWLGEEELLWRSEFHWTKPMSFELETASESPLLRLIPHYRPLRYEGAIEVTDLGRRHQQLEPLLIFSWALAVYSHRRHAH